MLLRLVDYGARLVLKFLTPFREMPPIKGKGIHSKSPTREPNG